MRIDKYLKVSRLIKRRTIAAEACEAKRVKLNGNTVKPSAKVKEGDVIEIAFGDRIVKVMVTAIKETTKKDEAAELYKIL